MAAVAVNRITRWVYVTGVPRSGSTFVGKVLSLPLSVDYLHEPFNPAVGIEGLRQRYLYVRPALDTADMQAFDEAAARLFRYDVRFPNRVPADDTGLRRLAKRAVGSRGVYYLRLAKLNPFHRAAVVKDPTAPFVADHLERRFGAVPVVVVRHPVSLAASLKRLRWHPDLRLFAKQPALVEDFFAAPAERALLEKTWDDPLEAAAVHWRAVHRVLLAQAEAAEARHATWHVLTHEAISAAPVPAFRDLYGRLDLPWSERVERRLRALTEGDTAEARDGRVQDFRRDSAALFAHRRSQLTRDERQRIYDLTADVALRLYTRDSFGLDGEAPEQGTGAATGEAAVGAPTAHGR